MQEFFSTKLKFPLAIYTELIYNNTRLKHGGDKVSEREKQIAEKLAAACEQLPDGKKEFLIGYAEGVAAMAGKVKEQQAKEK